MSGNLLPKNPGKQNETFVPPNVSRRHFLAYAGVFGGLTTVALACSDDDNDNGSGGVSLGTGDVAILNYAYALEQLEAAFYTQVVASPFSGITDGELALLTDIRDHEIAHREFFKLALSSNAIPALSVNFSTIDFTKRDSVLATAKAFEDLGVSAYNGAGRYIQTADYLVIAGKIVSVEARHAAYVRDLISNGSFAGNDVVAMDTGLDLSRKPKEVLSIASAYINTKINAGGLPS
ncbi:Tat (twin-arginine translocation) pathway signal sequence containing protein [Chitinophaga caeni]|uniref:Tat (Twin-arginine translocation) pathway signal sequence containing protein n=1 Tax=Chitinophaga caeni TaxID=2029983 RepID=A0A291QYX1_9BACT|nr:ferritin-like domain-containing protein [Chitinophaga caeni]ATL49135.1 Tat (twin-arginine translocation) pathway signal sequence containing protein [Chitinophaga caeni]